MLIDQLSQDLNAAMKAKDDVRTGTLRLLLSASKNKRIELGHDLSDAEFLAVVEKEVKQRKDSISQYQAADRQDLADAETAEMNVLVEYLPEQMDAAAIEAEVAKAIASTGATAQADMGKVMAALGHLKGQADMAQVSSLVKQHLDA